MWRRRLLGSGSFIKKWIAVGADDGTGVGWEMGWRGRVIVNGTIPVTDESDLLV